MWFVRSLSKRAQSTTETRDTTGYRREGEEAQKEGEEEEEEAEDKEGRWQCVEFHKRNKPKKTNTTEKTRKPTQTMKNNEN